MSLFLAYFYLFIYASNIFSFCSLEAGENEVLCSHSQSVDLHPQPKKKKNGPIEGNRSSPVWKHYNWVIDDEQLYAKCMYCGTKYKGDSRLGTTTAGRHTKGCEKYKEHLTNNPVKIPEFDQKVYCRLFAEAIIKHSYPLIIVEHEGLRKVHYYLNNNVRAISRNTILKHCCNEHESFKVMLRGVLDGLTSRVCLTCDCWSALNTRGYLTLTAHYVDNNWKLRSKILNFRYFAPPHNGVDIYHFVMGLLKEWGLDGKTFSMTVDNASAMDVMISLLKSDLNSSSQLPCDGKFFHVRCSAHVLNLIVQAGLKVVHGCVIKLRDTAKYIDHSDARLTRFDQCVKDVGSDFVGKLCLDMPVRWNSTYLMLEKAIKAKDALQLFSTRENGFRFALSFEEWEISEFVPRFLKPFYKITMLFSGSEYPTANLYFSNIVTIESLLVEAHNHRMHSIRDMAEKMMSKFEKYWSEYSLVLSIAVVLDPRYKLKFVKRLYSRLYSQGVDEKIKVINDAFLELYMFYASSTNSTHAAYSQDSTMPSSSSQPISVVDDTMEVIKLHMFLVNIYFILNRETWFIVTNNYFITLLL